MLASELKPIRLWVRLGPETAAKLDRYAGHKGASRARLLREIVEEWLNEKPDEPEGEPDQQERKYDQSSYMRLRRRAADGALGQSLFLVLRGHIDAMASMVDEAAERAAQEQEQEEDR